MSVCLRDGCGAHFTPEYKAHLFCSSGCWTAVLHAEIGVQAAGMRPFGFMGDRKKIQSVIRKYKRLAIRP